MAILHAVFKLVDGIRGERELKLEPENVLERGLSVSWCGV
jgi:hypothetical protein